MAKKSSKKKSNSSGNDGKPSDARTPSKAEGQETTDKKGAGGLGGNRSPLEGVVSPKIGTGGGVMEEWEIGVSDGSQAPQVESVEETEEETGDDKDDESVRRGSANGSKPSYIRIPARTGEHGSIQLVSTPLLFHNECMTISDTS